MNPWALPAPFDAVLWVILEAAKLLAATVLRMSSNIGELGTAWVLAYWLTVATLLHLGSWGALRIRKARAGSDFFEFDPSRGGGGGWVGRIVFFFRLQVAAEAWAAGLATAVGYGGALTLLALGLVWRWLALVVGLRALARALELRRRRTPWWL